MRPEAAHAGATVKMSGLPRSEDYLCFHLMVHLIPVSMLGAGLCYPFCQKWKLRHIPNKQFVPGGLDLMKEQRCSLFLCASFSEAPRFGQ